MTDNTQMVSVPRELLEDLLGSAQAEAAERRAALGSFRPRVQAALDKVVSDTQALLTAPAENVRAVVDEPEIVAIVESALRRSFTLGQVYWQQADSESTRQQNKSDQTMETQSNHIAMVVKSIKSLIK